MLLWKFQSINSQQVSAAASSSAQSTQAVPVKAGNFELGDQLPDFQLTDTQGDTYQFSELKDENKFVVVNFHHPDCPCAASCGRLINEMQQEGYSDVQVIGILSHDHDNQRVLKALDKQQTEGEITFPVYLDPTGKVLELFGATRTPEMWVLDKSGRIRFYGAPENTLFPGSEGHRYLLREAIDALRKGQTPDIVAEQPIGCPIE